MMTKTEKAERIIAKLLQRRSVISLRDDITPAFRGKDLPMTFAVWNTVKRGDMRRVGRGVYAR